MVFHCGLFKITSFELADKLSVKIEDIDEYPIQFENIHQFISQDSQKKLFFSSNNVSLEDN